MTTSSDFKWTDQNVAKLREMYAAGATRSKIAANIGGTKNAVIGKVHRLGLVRAPQPKAKAASIPRPERTPKRKPIAVDNLVKAARSPVERQSAFQALADKALDRFDQAVTEARASGDVGAHFLNRGLFQCAMPLPGWDDAPITEKMVCGKRVVIGTSWCRHCLAIVTQPARLREFRDRQISKGLAA